jgi:hypothetical protein
MKTLGRRVNTQPLNGERAAHSNSPSAQAVIRSQALARRTLFFA